MSTDNFESAKSYGQEIRVDAILRLMEVQVEVWKVEREAAIAKQQAESQYSTYESLAQLLAVQISTTEYWIRYIEQQYTSSTPKPVFTHR